MTTDIEEARMVADLYTKILQRERDDEAIAKAGVAVAGEFQEECWNFACDMIKGEGTIDLNWGRAKDVYETLVGMPDILPQTAGDNSDRLDRDLEQVISDVRDEERTSRSVETAADVAVGSLSGIPGFYSDPEQNCQTEELDLKSRLMMAYKGGTRWKKAAGFPGYSVSSSGQVRNDRTGRTLAQPKTHDGYALVSLMKNGEKHSVHVHTLVARTFHGAQKKGQDVRHKNTNKNDNTAKNTAYGTRSENMRDTYPNGHKRKK